MRDQTAIFVLFTDKHRAFLSSLHNDVVSAKLGISRIYQYDNVLILMTSTDASTVAQHLELTVSQLLGVHADGSTLPLQIVTSGMFGQSRTLQVSTFDWTTTLQGIKVSLKPEDIALGPLLSALKYEPPVDAVSTPEPVKVEAGASATVAAQPENADPAFYEHHSWKQRMRFDSNPEQAPITITISGAHGSGKTTLAILIAELLARNAINANVVDEEGPLYITSVQIPRLRAVVDGLKDHQVVIRSQSVKPVTS